MHDVDMRMQHDFWIFCLSHLQGNREEGEARSRSLAARASPAPANFMIGYAEQSEKDISPSRLGSEGHRTHSGPPRLIFLQHSTSSMASPPPSPTAYFSIYLAPFIPLFNEAICDEIRGLQHKTQEINATFISISIRLGDTCASLHKNAKTPYALRQRIESMKTEWDQYHKVNHATICDSSHVHIFSQQYTSLLWKSRTVAGDGEGAIRFFLEDLIPTLRSTATSFEAKLLLISQYSQVSSWASLNSSQNR